MPTFRIVAAVSYFLLNLHSLAWAESPALCDPSRDSARGWMQNTPGYRLFRDQVLPRCKNNTWYTHNESPTAFVFVHGLGSESIASWLDENSDSYWPDLIRTDPRYENPSIFLAGYPTAITGTDPYSIRHAANSVFDALNTPTVDGKASILSSKKNIIFVCHSMGGVVVRHMLSRTWNTDVFKDRVLGLVLVASPSLGSKVASAGNAFLPLFGRNLSVAAAQLRWHTDFLSELHDDFLYLRNRSVLPHLKGIELYEAQFILTGGPRVVVERDSAVRYFEPSPISGSDHWTIAKPNKNGEESANTKLVAFYTSQIKPEVIALSKIQKPKRVVLMDSYARIYDRANALPGEMNSHVIKRDLSSLSAEFFIEPVHDNWNDAKRIIDHHADLVIIHYSSLDSNTNRNVNALQNFLNDLLRNSPTTKVIVYSRGAWTNFDEHVRSLVDRAYRERVMGLHVAGRGRRAASFANEVTASNLRAAVTASVGP